MRARRGVGRRGAVAGLLAGALVLGGTATATGAVSKAAPNTGADRVHAVAHVVPAGTMPAHRPAGRRAGYVVHTWLLLLHVGPSNSSRVVSMVGFGSRITAATTTVNGFRQLSQFVWAEAKYLVPTHK